MPMRAQTPTPDPGRNTMAVLHLNRRSLGTGLIAAVLLGGCASKQDLRAAAGTASVVERLEILERKPAYGGTRFAEVGDYEFISAVAHMRVDPKHPANSAIVDLAHAAEADGAVRYKTNVVMLRPRDASEGFTRRDLRGGQPWSQAAARICPRRRRSRPRLPSRPAPPGPCARATRWSGLAGRVMWRWAATARASAWRCRSPRPGGQPITGTSVEEIVFDAVRRSANCR